ncbi:hypothetical protein QYE76_063531 [Lolium multiflorum]|uniref:Retrotransposon gag domain-containing protein n=1 Tax=Lolium multiflorum TaxID=4521 RepID=A0AAD8S4Q9_LOLMU|nr:hypothetical protein QYE76_063531 [Lolium multiflorum]
MMTWADFKLKFSKYHVPPGLIKKMRDEFRELKQGRMSVVEYRDRFLTLSRYAPMKPNEKRKERFLNGLHDEMQTEVNIPFADLEALVDSSIQMEGKLHQANENRKRRMMNRVSRPVFDRSGGNPRPGGPHHNNNPNSYVHHNNNFNRAPPRAPNTNNNNTNNAPRTGSNAIRLEPRTSPQSPAMNVELWDTSPMSAPKAGQARRQHLLSSNAVSPPARSSPPTTRTTAEVASTT